MSNKSNHSDFLHEQEDKKQQTLKELAELRALLGKETTTPSTSNSKVEEDTASIPDVTEKASDTKPIQTPQQSETLSEDTVLIEHDIYQRAQEEQAKKEERERQERIRRTSPAKPTAERPHRKKKPAEKKQAEKQSAKPKTAPAARAEDGGTGGQPPKKPSREQARRRRAAARQRRLIGVAVVCIILVIVIAAAVRTIVTASGSKQMSAAGNGSAVTSTSTNSSQVVTEAGHKIDWDDSKKASEQITDQYLEIKDDPDAYDYEKLYPGLYADSREIATEESDSKVCYLTFDDGPSDTVTPSILDTLEKYDVKATFFLVASEIEGNEALVQRMIDDGDTVCIHANVHEYDTIYASVEAYLEDFAQAYDTIYEATGYRVQGFRFPGGSNNGIITSDDTLYQAIANEMIRRGFEYYDWNAYDGDAEGSIPEASSLTSRAIEEVNESSRNDVILLMHDTYGKENTAEALPTIINGLRDDGIELLPITSSTRPVHFYVDDSTPSEYSLEAETSDEGTESDATDSTDSAE